MEPIIQKLQEYRDHRREEAELKYSQIVLRFDHPQPDDAQALDEAMKELNIDQHELESDIQLIHQYRAYLGQKGERNPNIRGGKEDAENIRRMHPRLFLAMGQDDESAGPARRGGHGRGDRPKQ
jgi:hypothetical protein